jgi:YrbI family 3-deoxy-D-manno-octulosonate 8-phosphate phosphatase
MNKIEIRLRDLDALFFDFDGVLTNNRVILDENGNEWVSCNRSDGLAFDVFRKLGTKVYIFSTEKNLVVRARANKLGVPVLQGIGNKVDALKKLVTDEKLKLSRVLYMGNDLNDLRAMRLCGYSVCPADSHPIVAEEATITLQKNGGDGVVRELIEDVLNEDILQILYPE